MTLFHYKAVNGSGEVIEGTMDAASQAAAVAQLNRSGLVPIRADHRRPGRSLSELLQSLTFQRGVSSAQLAVFTRQLTMLLDAGLSLDRALQAATGVAEKALGKRLEGLSGKVRSGASLTQAFAATSCFPDFYIGMIEAGEASGKLNAVLHRLADHLEAASRLRESLISAMIYPALVALTCLGSLCVFIGCVLPQFQSILVDAGAPVPFTAQALLSLAAAIGTGAPASTRIDWNCGSTYPMKTQSEPRQVSATSAG